MNIPNMQKLRDALAKTKLPVAFDMRNWFTHNSYSVRHMANIKDIINVYTCGTSACIAGQAVVLAINEGAEINCLEVDDNARNWLGLSWSEASRLFYGKWETSTYCRSMKDITVEQAITELDFLIENEGYPTMTSTLLDECFE